MTITEQLAELRRLLDVATPGSWSAVGVFNAVPALLAEIELLRAMLDALGFDVTDDECEVVGRSCAVCGIEGAHEALCIMRADRKLGEP